MLFTTHAMKIKIRNIILLQIVLTVLPISHVFSLPTDSIRKAVDTVIIPSADVYKNTWGGTHTRLQTDLFNKQTTYCLPLRLEGESDFVFPCKNQTYVCSPYGMRSGRMHTGMDVKQKLGDSIVAAWDGVVRMASKSYYAYGGTVVIRHANGLETLYSHLSALDVVENQVVKAGDLIGRAGRTGRATTEHLHFETRFLYEHFDPRTIIDFNTFSLSADTLFIRNGKFKASKFSASDDIVVDSNDMASGTVQSASDTASVSQNPSKPQEIKTTTNATPKFHIVKKGDTLYSIAKRYNTSVSRLCKLNNLTDAAILSIGQKLKLE